MLEELLFGCKGAITMRISIRLSLTFATADSVGSGFVAGGFRA